MKKIVLILIALSLICLTLSGCIHWKTSVNYELMHDISSIKSIGIYSAELFDVTAPGNPCGELLGEIPSDQFAVFTAELTDRSFVDSHLILLFPAAYDPNLFYGDPIVKIEYHNGHFELISNGIQSEFQQSEQCSDWTGYSVDEEQWQAFLRKWVEMSKSTND